MRLFVYTLFLITTSLTLQANDSVEPNLSIKYLFECNGSDGAKISLESDYENPSPSLCLSFAISGVSKIDYPAHPEHCGVANNSPEAIYNNNSVTTFKQFKKTYFSSCSSVYYTANYRAYLNPTGTIERESCPDTHPILKNGLCYAAEDNCPEPTENDYFQPGTGGGQQEYCYTNPDGTQCKITTDENGDFTLPYQYGTQEPSICHDEPVDTPDPDPMPDVPETPDADDPTPDDNTQGDDSDKTADIDALNQINDNLTIINDSINTASDANSERLNLIKDNIDNSNLYLDSIEENTGKALGALQQQTALLAEIRDKEDKDKAITVNAERKTSGLNSLFTTDDLNTLKAQLDVKKSEYNNLYLDIENQIKQKFDFNINATGQYESHTLTAYGKTEEIGLSRFSDPLFKQLAPIVLLLCSLLAVGLLLWK